MSNHIKKNPTEKQSQALADAEAQLAIAAEEYTNTGGAQFGSLMKVSEKLTKLKEAYKKTPKHERPERTWKKFVKIISARYKLTFKSARMADLCIALGKDINALGREKVIELVPDGSYRGVRSAVNALIGKSDAKPISATSLLLRAIKGVAAAEKLLFADAQSQAGQIKVALQELYDSLKADQPAPEDGTAAPKTILSTLKGSTFKPKTVKEIADFLGGKTALGRAVGKKDSHAHYWVNANKFPTELRPMLVKEFHDKDRDLDLSLIEKTGKPAK